MSVSANAIDFTDHWSEAARAELDAGQVSFETFWHLLWAWSRRTFGPVSMRGPIGPIRHLIKECSEAIAEVEHVEQHRTGNDPAELAFARAKLCEEFADFVFLTFDAVQRAGFTLTDLKKAIAAKYKKNVSRKWNPTTADQPVEHVREHAPDGE